ncbi:hypothetical protein CDAR_5161 [Caerostris darwini]|uniref:Uncharacterized protein n=1 Tax=Caerostris darwini TaxID=1538125 RepID=A0AAV4P5E0_9ARAC|nr:hypothetical protein CDAR_5161 [Caerostris darwini]
MATDKCLYCHVAPVGAAIGSHVTGRRRSSRFSLVAIVRLARARHDKLRLCRGKTQLQHREGFVFATVFVSTPPSTPYIFHPRWVLFFDPDKVIDVGVKNCRI